MSSPACAEGYDTPAQQREDSTTFMLSRSWHGQIIYRASAVKLSTEMMAAEISTEHSMRISVGYGGPARGQARKLRSCDEIRTRLGLLPPWTGLDNSHDAVVRSLSCCTRRTKPSCVGKASNIQLPVGAVWREIRVAPGGPWC